MPDNAPKQSPHALLIILGTCLLLAAAVAYGIWAVWFQDSWQP
jgi:hypothetical protein